ncbi:hypothetical protein PAECIP111893_00662 [Paenibacillus plantiphilus]|uniref:Lipoprotein n=1 Tax=Paenibacillus plantiphilus TaxID=2905650 RepID=A0ABN8G7H2_9BACL|nr:hypothetical protein [Paenibacillus plantiphilus]CAH1195295.1 hypothetical protein PAECIP111893_00662 [Paenibacillus plantiphilus]
MKKTIVFIIAVVSVIVMGGCSNPTSEYPYVLIFNNTQYYLLVEQVPQDQIGEQVGEVNRKVDPMPKENEQSNFSESSKLFEIKGYDPDQVIAVEIEGEYQKAKKNLKE